jgi:hypothetical protein
MAAMFDVLIGAFLVVMFGWGVVNFIRGYRGKK